MPPGPIGRAIARASWVAKSLARSGGSSTGAVVVLDRGATKAWSGCRQRRGRPAQAGVAQ